MEPATRDLRLRGAMFLAVVLGGMGLFVLLLLAAAWGITRPHWRFWP